MEDLKKTKKKKKKRNVIDDLSSNEARLDIGVCNRTEDSGPLSNPRIQQTSTSVAFVKPTAEKLSVNKTRLVYRCD